MAMVQPLLTRRLAGSEALSLADGTLVIGLHPRNAEWLTSAGPSLQPAALERFFARSHGAELRVRFEILDGASRPKGRRRPPPPRRLRRLSRSPPPADLRQWREHPAVKQVLEAFNAKILRAEAVAVPQPNNPGETE
jgi:hypothetical protein